jgi:hypothetical protein
MAPWPSVVITRLAMTTPSCSPATSLMPIVMYQ